MSSTKTNAKHAQVYGPEPGPVNDAPGRRLSRRWWCLLGGIVLLGGLSQALILREAWRDNPLAASPVVDGEEYWAWAGEIAQGHLRGEAPFTSAPLYAYLVAIVRAVGGGLLTTYVLQAGLHCLTVGLLTFVAAKRFGAAVGLLTGVLYVLLLEPAYTSGRILNGTLQLALVVSLWAALCACNGLHL